MAVAVRRQPARRQQLAWRRPIEDIEQLQELLESVLPAVAGEEVRPWIPAVDVEEADDAWLFEAELPGVKRADMNVELRDNELAITGEIKEKERKGILRRRTRKVGEFEFRATLPGPADAEHVEANLEDGVLTVRVPKAQQARSHRVEIGGADGHGSAGAEQPA
jgi:HSP20 family protein